MDSNRTHIREDKFWTDTDSTVKKIVVSKAELLTQVIKKHSFNQVEHFIIGTGTNDTDKRNAQDIFADLKQGANLLHQQYGNANVYVSQIPPRKNRRKEVVAELNNLIEEGMPESVHLILQKELDESDLHDEKHIKIKSLGKYVVNIKNKMREVLGLPLPNRDRTTRGSPPHRRNANGNNQQVDTNDGDLKMMKMLMNFRKFLNSCDGDGP